MPVPDPGPQGMKALVVVAWLFSTASWCLYTAALFLNTWSVAKDPANANGGLGLYEVCPNTQAFADNSSHSLDTACIYVDGACRVTIGYVVPTPSGGGIYTYFSYNIFDPRPLRPDDKFAELLQVFPGDGSCNSYMTARSFGMFAAMGALIAWMSAPFSICAPSRRRTTGSTGTGCVCCALVCGIISLSVWASSVINWQTSQYGSGFWCMVSAVIIGALSIPCLSAFAVVKTDAPEYQAPPPNYYGQPQQPYYQPGQQYQYGAAPGAPPTAAPYYPQAPPANQQYGATQPPPAPQQA